MTSETARDGIGSLKQTESPRCRTRFTGVMPECQVEFRWGRIVTDA